MYEIIHGRLIERATPDVNDNILPDLAADDHSAPKKESSDAVVSSSVKKSSIVPKMSLNKVRPVKKFIVYKRVSMRDFVSG